jgi:hypothetical protein
MRQKLEGGMRNSRTTHLRIEQTSPVDMWITSTLSTDGNCQPTQPPKPAQLGFMMSLVTVGVLILSALSIVCFAAYKIRAKSFEVSTSVWKIASFSIKIISADAENRESARDRVELLRRDVRRGRQCFTGNRRGTARLVWTCGCASTG